MRILIVKVPHGDRPVDTWMVAYSLPFTVVGTCNYGSQGDLVTLELTLPHTAREQQAQEIFSNHVGKIAADMGKNVHVTVRKPEDIVARAYPQMSLSWLTDHRTKGA